MHTAFDLKKRMFSVSVSGETVDPYAILDWGPTDRLGIIIDRPVGAIRAGMLTMLAACAFYDVPGKKRRQKPIYPEIYLFHAGGPWGCFINFDFWPDHKEVFVDRDPREMLRAINNRGITHLAVPDRPRAAVEHRFKEPEAATDRIKLCLAYNPEGETANADVCLSTDNIALLSGYECVLAFDDVLSGKAQMENAIPLRLQPKSASEIEATMAAVAPRVAELKKDSPSHRAGLEHVATSRANGSIVERYRRLNVAEALEMLA